MKQVHHYATEETRLHMENIITEQHEGVTTEFSFHLQERLKNKKELKLSDGNLFNF